MQYKKLFLAGDATHIVPPTGAKGLNLAVSDVYYLSKALDSFFNYKKSDLLEKYSETALRRVWSGINISWQFTNLLHKFNEDPFELKIKQNQYDMLLNYKPMQAAVAFEAVGLPL